MKFKDYRGCSVLIGQRRHSGVWFTLGASIVTNKWSSIGQSFRRSVRFQVARFLSSSNDSGTIQSRNSARRRTTRLSQTENVCEIAFWTSSQKIENLRIQSQIAERVAATEGKGQNSFTKRKTGECFKCKANGSCSKGDSSSFLHSHASGTREKSAEVAENTGVSSLKPAVDNEWRRKGKLQASSSVPTGKGRTDDKRSKSLGDQTFD